MNKKGFTMVLVYWILAIIVAVVAGVLIYRAIGGVDTCTFGLC